MPALLVDYGGVLTTDVFEAFRGFCAREGLEPETIPHVLVEDDEARRDLHGLELGTLPEGEFEQRFAARLGVDADRLLERILADLRPDRAMIDGVRRVRAAGVPVAITSNSWGLALYDRPLVAELGDVVLVSAEVGLRKPDPAFFRLAAEQLGVGAAECVVVDDLRPNVVAAGRLGMRGILHRSAAETLPLLAATLGVT